PVREGRTQNEMQLIREKGSPTENPNPRSGEPATPGPPIAIQGPIRASGANGATSNKGEGGDDGNHPEPCKLGVDGEEARGCESDRESEQRGEIAEHGHVERSDIAILKRSEIGQGGSKQEDDEEHGEYARTVADEAEPTWNWLTP